jgi:hypothetical protein
VKRCRLVYGVTGGHIRGKLFSARTLPAQFGFTRAGDERGAPQLRQSHEDVTMNSTTYDHDHRIFC